MANNKNIYGVDLDKPITPLIARDALERCFFEAHCADAETGTDDLEINSEYIRSLVKKIFADSGGDFENPTKQSIIDAINKLQEFSKNFRDPDIIQKHASEMMKIVEKIA